MTFGEKLKSLREKHGITQEDLSTGLNKLSKQKRQGVEFTADQVKNWEINRNLPSMERSILISKFFNVTLDTLFRPDLRVTDSKIIFKNFILN
jgi:transcriptional regulator with XRE-family HTH domain